MIKLITGLPGSGKSLRAVWRIHQHLGNRPIYVCGIDGFHYPAGTVELVDPLKWEDLPDGSLVVVDEAQKYFPSRRSGDPVPPVRALSEHRHRGFDFILITQHPTMLDSYVRKLVGEHDHVVRQFGMQASKVLTWQEAFDDPQSLATRDRATGVLWPYPKECFTAYKSATMHTVKPRIPARLLLLPAILVVVAVLAWYGYDAIAGFGKEEAQALATAHQAGLPAGVVAMPGVAVSGRPLSLRETDPDAWLRPRVDGQPWTAPAYDDRDAAPPPRLACMSSADSCTCVTVEQGTIWGLSEYQCRVYARVGFYDPTYTSAAQPDRQQRTERPAAPAAPVVRERPAQTGWSSIPIRTAYTQPQAVPNPTIAGIR